LETVPSTEAEGHSAPGSGELRVASGDGAVQQFPLKHTEIRAEITGRIGRVRVTQTFHNPYEKKIEAVYVFPLPSRAAVDDMEIRVGGRTTRGVIKRREEARALYEEARRAGHVAALLDQERPNIFTQSVTNILPGEEVVVSLRYFETLPYESGAFEFTFPMVVGPRFIPGAATITGERGWSPDTTEVPDASRITPPVLKPGRRSAHDVSLEVRLDAGTPLRDLASPSHRIRTESGAPGRAVIRLAEDDSMPNKDFGLRYRIDGAAPNMVLFPHRSDGDGYFLILIQPEAAPANARITPKEMIFVVDCSGSMSGPPIEKVKEAMRHALANLNPIDTFQIVRFSNAAETFAPEPVPATFGNIQQALEYVDGLSGQGGTIMIEGVRTALGYPEDPQRLRIISFMTDGYIGNEEAILAYLAEHLGGARLFSFGVGSAPNRYLLDKMAEFGHGAVEYVLLNDTAEAPVLRFYDRIRNPYLTDIEIDWNDLKVKDVYPERIPDLFLGQPILLHGRYTRPGAGEVTLRARLGGRPYEQRLPVHLPERHDEGEAIGTLWARARIEDLSARQIVNPLPVHIEEITQLALAHRLVSAYTSFVAVEERIVTGTDKPHLVEVPVAIAEGVSYEAVFGREPGVELTEKVVARAIGGVAGGMLSGGPQSTTSTTTFSAELVNSLPVLGRNAQEALVLSPGVTGASPTIHGSRETEVIGLADGCSTADPAAVQRGQQLVFDSIEEIEVQSSGASAPFSRAQGGLVSVIEGELEPDADELPFGACTLEAPREEYRQGELIEVRLVIENRSRKTILLPAELSIAAGTARFQVLDEDWNVLEHPAAFTLATDALRLRPGKRITFRLTINGPDGYRIERLGIYQVVFLGSDFGLLDSNVVTVTIGR
jgi:Ca-activated chloride channel family protein